MVRGLIVAANAWFTFVSLLFIMYYAFIIGSYGFGEALDIMIKKHFNGAIPVLVTVVPGFLLHRLAKRYARE